MKIIKPLRLSIIHRPGYRNGEPYLGIAVMALVGMAEKPLLRPEPELWQLAQSELSCCGGIIDLACPKRFAEFLAVGRAYPHSYLRENVCRVSIKLGEKHKALIVSGDREWQGETPTPPRPFKSIPVDWSRAYGGPQTPDNPLGIGAAGALNNGAVQPLPNIELAAEPVTSPAQAVTPVSFAAIDVSWPARQALIGTRYDEAWIKQGMRGFADDADPRLFNMAPLDQQWPEFAALPQGLAYQIENMHPSIPLLTGTLPAWNARCFAHHMEKGEETFSEIALRQTTVWFLPHLEKMILVYHGEMPLEEDDAHDVHMLMPALEDQNQPRSLSHYREVWIKRSDREKGAAFAFQESDLLPHEAIGPWIDTEASPSQAGYLQQNLEAGKQAIYQQTEQRLQKVNAQLPAGTGDAPEIEHPTLSQLPEFMAQMEALADKKKEAALLQAKQRLPDTQAYDSQRATGPESFYKIRDAVRRQQGQLHAGQEENLYQLYRLGVAGQNPAARLSWRRGAELREWVIGKLAQDRDFTGCDLTGADLSELDFSGANLTRTMMESADLSLTIMDNATLTQTLLARTQMKQTSLRNAVISEATLALANCSDCDFTGANLNSLITEGAQFERCNFSQIVLSNQLFDDTSLTDCDFSAARLENVIFNGISLEDPRFASAKLYKNTFVDCQLLRAVFTGATLQRCSLSHCQADDSDFTRASLENCAFVSKTSLERARFSHAQLKQCNLRQAPLTEADMRFTTLDVCDLSCAVLRSANLSRLQASSSLFIRTDLHGASLRQANLIGCRSQKSRLTGSDLTAANLFRADISQAEMDDATLMQDACTQRLKIYPLHKGATQC